MTAAWGYTKYQMIYGSDCDTDVKPVYFPYEFRICKERAFKVKVKVPLDVTIKKDVRLFSTITPPSPEEVVGSSGAMSGINWVT